MNFYFWRFSLRIDNTFEFYFFDNTILDVIGFRFGFLTFGFWYDDTLEGLK